MAGATVYPGALDNFAESSPTNLGDNDSTGRTHAERHDDIESAMEAVQGELGTDPAGAYSTVDARLNAIDNGGTSIFVTASGTAVVPLTVAGTASQAADLAQFKNSGGTAVASISAAGAATFDSVDADSYKLSGSDLLTSTALLGTPTAPTAAVNTDTTQVATTAFVLAQAGTAAPVDPDTAAAVGTSKRYAREDHVHSADFGGSLLKTLPAPVPAGEQLLKQAVWWIDSAHSSASGQSVSNLGWGASALDARLGSASGADSNDPKFLDWDGENYVYLPGVAGNYLSVPDEAALDITGDIDIRVRVAFDDWTSSNPIVGKFAASGNRSYFWNLNADGTTYFGFSVDGAATTGGSSVAWGFADGTAQWMRVTRDKAAGEIKFWKSTDGGVTWTQHGSTVTGVSTSDIFASTAALRVGYYEAGSVYSTAKVYRAQVLNGIDGTPVLDVDCSQITSGSNTSFTALTGQTVTINRSTSGRKAVAVTHPCWLFGTDDFMEVPARWVDAASGGLFLPGVAGNYASAPDSAAVSVTGDITIDAYVRLDDWKATAGIVSKRGSSSSTSYMLYVSAGLLFLFWSPTGTQQSETSTAAVGFANGAAKWIRATLDVDNGAGTPQYEVKFFTSDDGSTWSQLGATVTGTTGVTSIVDNGAELAVGAATTAGGAPAKGTIYRARIYDTADGSGSPVFDADFTGQAALATTFTEDSTNAATVTVNTSGSGYVATLVPASGYVKPTGAANFQPSSYSLLDFGASDSFTVLAVVRQWANAVSNGVYVTKKADTSSATRGYMVYRQSSQFPQVIVADGTSIDSQAITVTPSGAVEVIASTRDRTANTIGLTVNGVFASNADTVAGSLSNSEVFRIGRRSGSGATAYQDFEFIAAAIFRRALTSGEITTLSNYFAGRVA